jgi:hypothetical protein
MVVFRSAKKALTRAMIPTLLVPTTVIIAFIKPPFCIFSHTSHTE